MVFFQSRLESHWPAPRSCRRTRRESADTPPATTKQKKPPLKPSGRKESRSQAIFKKKLPPPPSQVVSRSVCGGFYYLTKGKVNLWRSSPSPPPPPPPTRLSCLWCEEAHYSVFKINTRINKIYAKNKINVFFFLSKWWPQTWGHPPFSCLAQDKVLSYLILTDNEPKQM